VDRLFQATGLTASGSNTTFGTVGAGQGGAIFTHAGATITDSGFVGNKALGGSGDSYTSSSGNVLVGYGGGGALYEESFHTGVLTSLSVNNCTFTKNLAVGGAGNAGGSFTGDGIGGAIMTLSFTGAGTVSTTVSASTFTGNQAMGGAGSAGRNGADGLGGALANVLGATLSVSGCTLSGNQASGGAGGSGAMGGNGFGGGLYNDGSSTLNVTGSTVTNNQAIGGGAGSGGSAGDGLGGGAYFALGGDACLDLLTSIIGNTAATSDDDVLGSFTIC
jgi:hypothetical protein